MLGRQVRVYLVRPQISPKSLATASRRPLDGPGHLSRRSISSATFTEPIGRAVASLPYAIQHDIPQAILNFSSAAFPESWPVYSIGFFAFAVATRLLVFTPWAYWARKRKWRTKEVVEPRLIAEFKYGWSSELRDKLRRKGLTSREWLMAINDNMSIRQKELVKQFDCGSFKTTVLPLAFTAPAFILSTSIAFSASLLPEIASNPTLNEFFLALPTQDHFPLLPVGLGVFALLTTDIGTWSPKSLKQMNSIEAPVAEEETNNGSPSKIVEVKPHIIALTFSRLWSLARVVVAIGLPGTVQIIWFTSALMSFLEARIFSWIESRRRNNWGGNSPLIKMKIGQLRKLGVEISPDIPLERLGVVDYSTATPGYFPRPRQVGPLERARDAIADLSFRLKAMSPGPTSSAQPADHVRDGFVRVNERGSALKEDTAKQEEVKVPREGTKKSKKGMT